MACPDKNKDTTIIAKHEAKKVLKESDLPYIYSSMMLDNNVLEWIYLLNIDNLVSINRIDENTFEVIVKEFK